MTWVDLALLAGLGACVFVGMRVGLIRAALTFASLVIGWFLAGQISGVVVESIDVAPATRSALNSFVTLAILILASTFTAWVLRFLKPALATVTLGLTNMVDSAGGAALGLLVGVVLIGAGVVVGARLTYQFEKLEGGDSVVTRSGLADGGVAEGLESLMGESEIIGALVNVATWLPGGALGLAPGDFGVSLDLLEKALD